MQKIPGLRRAIHTHSMLGLLAISCPPHPSFIECIAAMSVMSDDEILQQMEDLSPMSEDEAPGQPDVGDFGGRGTDAYG